MFLGVEAFYITLLDTHPLSFSPTLFHKKFQQWSKETSQINMLILSLCVQKKELWVGFYDHECCEFVSPFIPLFVLMTMVVVVNCVTIPILCCWGWGCCEWCDNSFYSCCGVVVNCVMIHSIVCCCVVDDNCCVMIDWSQVLWCCWCLLLWIVWRWFIHSAVVDGCLFSCCWRTNKPKGVPAQLPKGTTFGLFV
jgi:hypothetical protein